MCPDRMLFMWELFPYRSGTSRSSSGGPEIVWSSRRGRIVTWQDMVVCKKGLVRSGTLKL